MFNEETYHMESNKYLRLRLICRLTWKNHILAKRNQLGISLYALVYKECEYEHRPGYFDGG